MAVQIRNYTVPASLTIPVVSPKIELLAFSGLNRNMAGMPLKSTETDRKKAKTGCPIAGCGACHSDHLANVVQDIFPQDLYWANVGARKSVRVAVGE